ncbi:MAG: hypothetical protein NT029_21900 [Armatimonadetes bacterium]|nr:hypothetical protein [Armatimonadota bacterium]
MAKRPWPRWRIVLVAGLCVAVGAVGFWWALAGWAVLGDVSDSAARLPEELASARREKLPLEVDDLRRIPPVPPERNAAPLIRRMVDVETRLRADRAALADALKALRRPEPTSRDRQTAQRRLVRWAEMLSLAEAAARMPDCDFERPFEQGPDVSYSGAGASRAAAQLLAIRAILASDAGRQKEAFTDLTRCGRLAQHVGSDPALIPLLVRVALEATADAAFTRIVLCHMDDPVTLAYAERTLSALGPLPDLRYSIGGEVVISRACVDIVRKGGRVGGAFSEKSRRAAVPALLSAAGSETLMRAWESQIIAYWRRAYTILRKTREPGSTAQTDDLRKLWDEVDANHHRPSYQLLAMIAPTLDIVSDRITTAMAMRALRTGLVRLARYQQRHGGFPPSLADAGRTASVDPFTGRPLIYRQRGAGFILYCVGPDRKDDGGDAKRPATGGMAPDIVIQFPRQQ